MPFVIHVLGLGIFAQGTSEFMLSGVLPSVAHDLDVPLPSAGLCVGHGVCRVLGRGLGRGDLTRGLHQARPGHIGGRLGAERSHHHRRPGRHPAGPVVSGLVINTGLGLAGTAWIGAAFAVTAMGSTPLDRHLTRRHQTLTLEAGLLTATPNPQQATAATH
ncbi:hypothetical protein [Streptomyces sp. NBC_00365]|uniref:hypothetical protein n=1 Tax=Streptomyces sp. NBC_00365 TaxID=2975726 RepID=UPI002B1D4FB8|nr:hypothetical protein [Streptomyces sp. NBC_00365]